MGTIARFDLTDLHRRFGIGCFVETGTGGGEGITHAAKFDFFAHITSCEIEPGLYHAAAERFLWDSRVLVCHGFSVPFLRDVCGGIPVDEPILFWLDAHFIGADYGVHDYGHETDDLFRLPLELELRAIAALRPAARDVIVCDDLRIYVDGPFQHGNAPDSVRPYCPKVRGVGFAHELFGATHDVQELYEHEGYLLITPKGKTSDG